MLFWIWEMLVSRRVVPFTTPALLMRMVGVPSWVC